MEHRIHRHEDWDDEPTNPFEQLQAARILLAEDDPALRAMMATRLRQDGCDVAEARTGDEALDMITMIGDGEAPLADLDLVIIDVRMPGLSGLEVIRLLRSWQWSTPVLFVTAYPDPELAVEIGELDARLLAKPFGLSRLSNAALEAIRGRLS
jgi:DNA-binding response OmpR family regulator